MHVKVMFVILGDDECTASHSLPQLHGLSLWVLRLAGGELAGKTSWSNIEYCNITSLSARVLEINVTSIVHPFLSKSFTRS
jgi:hypothetical protein